MFIFCVLLYGRCSIRNLPEKRRFSRPSWIKIVSEKRFSTLPASRIREAVLESFQCNWMRWNEREMRKCQLMNGDASAQSEGGGRVGTHLVSRYLTSLAGTAKTSPRYMSRSDFIAMPAQDTVRIHRVTHLIITFVPDLRHMYSLVAWCHPPPLHSAKDYRMQSTGKAKSDGLGSLLCLTVKSSLMSQDSAYFYLDQWLVLSTDSTGLPLPSCGGGILCILQCGTQAAFQCGRCRFHLFWYISCL